MCSLVGVVLIARPAFLFGERAATEDEALPALELVEFGGMNITGSTNLVELNTTSLLEMTDVGTGVIEALPSERLIAVGWVVLCMIVR